MMVEEGNWVTINGAHILIKGDESPQRAFERTKRKEYINEFQKTYAKDKVEHLRAYKDGKIVAENHGTHHEVEYPSKEIAKDSDVIHNHPRNNVALSPPDVLRTIHNDAKSITSITKEGRRWTLTRPESGWGQAGKLSIEYSWKDAQSAINKSDDFKNLISDVKSKKITQAAANRKYTEWIARKAITENLKLTIEEE